MANVEKFITISDIQKLLQTQGLVWDGRKLPPTRSDIGEKALISDFRFHLVPVNICTADNQNAAEVLLQVSNTKFVILQEKDHPDDEFYTEEFADLTNEWTSYLIEKHGDRYIEFLIRKIDADIISHEKDFENIKNQLMILQNTTENEIKKLQDKKTTLLNQLNQKNESYK